MAVYNASGTAVMEITYDAWGNFTDTVSTMSYPPSTEQLQAFAIPFRYRGYVYDQETGFYYLNSRYYDPAMHRFINADSTSYLGANGDLIGYNLYAYCSNNPIMYSDPSGNTFFEWIANFVESFFESIEFEAGLGPGFGIGSADSVHLDASIDATVVYDDGEWHGAQVVNTGASVFGLGTETTHVQYTSGPRDDVHFHMPGLEPYDMAKEIVNCDRCSHNNTSGFSIVRIKDNSDVVIGSGFSLHFIYGGHISLGFNVMEFDRRVWGQED